MPERVSLGEILAAFESRGCGKVVAKRLAPNDNSKNQIYLGGHDAVGLLPSIKTTLTRQRSGKKNAGKYIFRNRLDFYWLNGGGPHPARHANLIYYPQYPETRFSGFLKGSSAGLSALFDERRKGDFPERVLFLSSSGDRSYGYVHTADTPFLKELGSRAAPLGDDGKFFEIHTALRKGDAEGAIISALAGVVKKGWIRSCRLDGDGNEVPYNAPNGGGYTLEAQLGIRPNSEAGPDYAGWEVKQRSKKSNAVTLLTPEPDAGFYKDRGPAAFIRRYGYPDKKGRANRMNFGGTYRNASAPDKKTGLALGITGFKNGSFTGVGGFVGLFDGRKRAVAKWTFPKLMEHWSRKHGRVVFVVSERKGEGGTYYYRYLDEITMGTGTNFVRFLRSVEKGDVYIDPALKLERPPDGREKIKTRNQFRIRVLHLGGLYPNFRVRRV